MKKLSLILFSVLVLFFSKHSLSTEKIISDFSNKVKVIDGDTITIKGKKVATINEENNKDCEIKSGNIFVGKIIPANIDFEKSVLGNKSKPIIKPNKIET